MSAVYIWATYVHNEYGYGGGIYVVERESESSESKW